MSQAALVIDGSTTLGFVLQDERGPAPLRALAALEQGAPAHVPAHWGVEVANGLLMAERRKRATQAEITEALGLVALLPVRPDEETATRAFQDTVALARQYGLIVYDAAYLELAMRKGARLATTDRALMAAARDAGVALLG
jgi:predicted nucleic acid-binding protein